MQNSLSSPESEYFLSVPAVGCIIPPLLFTSLGIAARKSDDMLLFELTLFRSNFIPKRQQEFLTKQYQITPQELDQHAFNLKNTCFKMSSIVLPSGSSCVLAKLMERRPLFSSFLFSKALAITLCFFSLTGLFEGFLNTLQQKSMTLIIKP